MKGRLHHNNRRPTGDVHTACRYLQNLLPRIVLDNEQWYGHPPETTTKSRTLIDTQPVCVPIMLLITSSNWI
jgi:hypothetical protein